MKTLRSRRDRMVSERLEIHQRQAQICLPPELIEDVPQCAHACILQWILQTFPRTDCASTSNLEVLCTTPASLTLGEASLQCVASDCASQATNNALLSAYRVCEGVDNALPNTRTVINATVRPGATAVPTVQNAAPATFTPSPTPPPAGGAQTSMVISADGMSVTMEIMMSATDSSARPPPTMTEIGSSFVPEDTGNTGSNGLSVSQIAGISSGVGMAALLVAAISILFFRRKRNASQDKLASVKQIPGPMTTASNNGTQFGVFPTRLYGQDKRRSFWRKSIRPEEIGIAVPSKSSPRDSVSSEESMLRYMPNTVSGQAANDRSSWPDFSTGYPATSLPTRPPRDSVSTIFDEDLEQLPKQSLGNSPYGRTVAVPRPMQLDGSALASPPLASSTTGDKSVTLSLTPTYDNGHFSQAIQAPPAQKSIDANLTSNVFYPAENTSPRRNKLQKKPGTIKAMISSPVALTPSRGLMNFATAEDAGLIPSPLKPLNSRPFSPAAVPKGIRQPREALVRGGSSFVVTDSTSSDGITSQYSLDWPVPPSRATLKGGLAASRGSTPVSPLNYARTVDQGGVTTFQNQTQSAQQQLSPNSRAKVTPTQKNSIGDLFFKVEMQ